MTGTGLRGKDKSSGQTDIQVISASLRPLSHAAILHSPLALHCPGNLPDRNPWFKRSIPLLVSTLCLGFPLKTHC